MNQPEAPPAPPVPPPTPPRFEEQREQIVARLSELIKQMKCPMCEHEHFTIVAGYLASPVQAQLSSFSIGGPTIPTAALVCNNCGFLSQHAIGTLGFLPQKGGDK